MTTCSRARSHKLRCSATPLPHNYRQQRPSATLDATAGPVMVYEVRGGRRHRTRLYGPGYQPCSALWEVYPERFGRAFVGRLTPAERSTPSLRGVCYGPRGAIPSPPCPARCSEGLPTYPYTTSCP